MLSKMEANKSDESSHPISQIWKWVRQIVSVLALIIVYTAIFHVKVRFERDQRNVIYTARLHFFCVCVQFS